MSIWCSGWSCTTGCRAGGGVLRARAVVEHTQWAHIQSFLDILPSVRELHHRAMVVTHYVRGGVVKKSMRGAADPLEQRARRGGGPPVESAALANLCEFQRPCVPELAELGGHHLLESRDTLRSSFIAMEVFGMRSMTLRSMSSLGSPDARCSRTGMCTTSRTFGSCWAYRASSWTWSCSS